jgi:hypothetical protein
MKKLSALLTIFCFTQPAFAAKPAFTGTDYSGVYQCNGDDSHEGKYTGTVTLKLNVAQSMGEYSAYDFKLEVPGYGAYPGHAAGQGDKLAIYFANTDPKTKDFGTGIATVKKGKDGKLAFRKYYYEPEFKGGNYGVEDCARK